MSDVTTRAHDTLHSPRSSSDDVKRKRSDEAVSSYAPNYWVMCTLKHKRKYNIRGAQQAAGGENGFFGQTIFSRPMHFICDRSGKFDFIDG